MRDETLAGLRQPERSEMLDFSDVFPAITREYLAERSREAARVARAGLPDLSELPHRRCRPSHPSVARHRARQLGSARPDSLRDRNRAGDPAPLLRAAQVRSYRQRAGDQEEPGLSGRWQKLQQALAAELPEWPALQALLALEAWPSLKMVRRLRLSHLVRLVPAWMLLNLLLLAVVLAALASQTVPRAIQRATSACQWYTVQANDTLYGIGASFHLPASSVATANHLKSYGSLHAGERLCIPAGLARLIPEAQDALEAPSLIATGPAVAGEEKFIQFALPYAESAHQQTGWPVSMILAQWGLEHGWQVPTFTGYNWGNVGALPGAPQVASGGAIGAPAYFAYAPTPQDGVNYYVAVASLSYYSAVAPAARAGGPDAAAKALGASPWDAAHYTGIGDPGSSLIILMHAFDLYKYDS